MKTNREKCIEMWEWIAGQPAGTAKYEYFKAKGIESPGVPESNCYACQEANSHLDENIDDDDGCVHCPLGYNGKTHCQDRGEPYDLWEKDETQKTATTFLEFIKENWKK